jgi:hypothetical protein
MLPIVREAFGVLVAYLLIRSGLQLYSLYSQHNACLASYTWETVDSCKILNEMLVLDLLRHSPIFEYEHLRWIDKECVEDETCLELVLEYQRLGHCEREARAHAPQYCMARSQERFWEMTYAPLHFLVFVSEKVRAVFH